MKIGILFFVVVVLFVATVVVNVATFFPSTWEDVFGPPSWMTAEMAMEAESAKKYNEAGRLETQARELLGRAEELRRSAAYLRYAAGWRDDRAAPSTPAYFKEAGQEESKLLTTREFVVRCTLQVGVWYCQTPAQ